MPVQVSFVALYELLSVVPLIKWAMLVVFVLVVAVAVVWVVLATWVMAIVQEVSVVWAALTISEVTAVNHSMAELVALLGGGVAMGCDAGGMRAAIISNDRATPISTGRKVSLALGFRVC